jgi:hypothetical protein
LEPFGVRIIGKPQAPPNKNKDHRNTLRPEVLDYFKRLAEETGHAYQKLIQSLSSRLCEEAQENLSKSTGFAREEETSASGPSGQHEAECRFGRR